MFWLSSNSKLGDSVSICSKCFSFLCANNCTDNKTVVKIDGYLCGDGNGKIFKYTQLLYKPAFSDTTPVKTERGAQYKNKKNCLPVWFSTILKPLPETRATIVCVLVSMPAIVLIKFSSGLNVVINLVQSRCSSRCAPLGCDAINKTNQRSNWISVVESGNWCHSLLRNAIKRLLSSCLPFSRTTQVAKTTSKSF